MSVAGVAVRTVRVGIIRAVACMRRDVGRGLSRERDGRQEMETDNPLEKVLDRLRSKGWMKGKLGYPEGPNCIIGAMGWVNDSWWEYDDGLEGCVEDVVVSQYPDRINDRVTLRISARFNDHPDTTFTDVERVLEKAAIKWEEERVTRDGNEYD